MPHAQPSARLRAALSAAFLTAVLLVTGLASGAHASTVVSRSTDGSGKGIFVLDSAPWVSLGWNDYTLSNHPVLGDQNCGDPMSSEDFSRQMNRIEQTGANTVRVWFFQEYYHDAPSGDRWKPFVRILEGAKSRGLKVVPVLMNQWSACDRADDDTYDAPGNNQGNLTADFYDDDYQVAGASPMDDYAYSARQWAQMVAKKFNPDSGYASTIAFFQLVNEAETRTTSSGSTCATNGAQTLRSFADDMTDAVKTAYLDGVPGRQAPLVSLGTMGIGQCGQKPDDAFPGSPLDNRSEYEYIHAGDIDICEVHDYDAMNEAWPTNVYGQAGNSFGNRIAECGAKPFVVGEAGIKANVRAGAKSRFDSPPTYYESDAVTTTTLDRRADWFSDKISTALANGTDGYLLWDKYFLRTTHPYNKSRHENFGIGAPGDPTTCSFRAFTVAPNCGPTGPPSGAPDSGVYLHYGFEEDSGGWGSDQWNDLAVGRSTYVSDEGSYAFAIQMSSNPTKAYSGVGTYYGLTGIDTGTSVTFRIHSAGDTNAVKVQPYVKDGSWAFTPGSITSLDGSGWQTVTFVVPTVDAVQAIGINFINESHQTGTVHVDNVRW